MQFLYEACFEEPKECSHLNFTHQCGTYYLTVTYDNFDTPNSQNVNCLRNRNCEFLLRIFYDFGFTTWQLAGYVGPLSLHGHYLALAILPKDQLFLHDGSSRNFIFICKVTPRNGKWETGLSFAIMNGTTMVPVKKDEITGSPKLSDYNNGHQDGWIYCQFKTKGKPGHNKFTIHLNIVPYSYALAKGDLDENFQPEMHHRYDRARSKTKKESGKFASGEQVFVSNEPDLMSNSKKISQPLNFILFAIITFILHY